jgi:uncharacterized membrane protein YeaQ/YmgE (transglycosylase-associated protein family)
MHRTAILFGLLLIALGLVGYFAPEKLGEVGEKGTSPTALIPAVIGAILLLCGLIVAAKPTLRKHVMHLAAVVGLLGAIGGVMPLMRTDFDFKKSSAVSGALMIGLCALFVILCVRSFVLARIARSEGLPEEPYADEHRARQKPV